MLTLSVSVLVKKLKQIYEALYAAARPLLAPYVLNKDIVTISDLRLLCECDGYTLTYDISNRVRIVKAKLGVLTEDCLPSRIDLKYMPPLRPFCLSGIIAVYGAQLKVLDRKFYAELVENTPIRQVLFLLGLYASKCRKIILLRELALTANRQQKELLRHLLIIRCLFPVLIELILPDGRDLTHLLQELRESGIKKLKFQEFLNELNKNELIIVELRRPDLLIHAYVRDRVESTIRVGTYSSSISARVSRRSGKIAYESIIGLCHPMTLTVVPKLFKKVSFKNKIVAELGCGYGTKGVYAIRHGAKLVLLIDLDISFLRFRMSGTHIERVCADIRSLPLRSLSVDVSILWNVVQFIRNKDSVLNETRRVTKSLVLFSVFNALSGYWKYTKKLFLEDCEMLGKVLEVRTVRNKQFMALIRVRQTPSTGTKLNSAIIGTDIQHVVGLVKLRRFYCLNCRNRSPRSYGVHMLENYLDKYNIKPKLILDYGCTSWRNSKYLRTKYGCEVVRVDLLIQTRPDVIAYPTYLPFRNNVFDVGLFTHILMFLNSKREMQQAIAELARVVKIAVIECWHTKRIPCLDYESDELEVMIKQHFTIVRRNVKRNIYEIYVLLAK